MPFGVCVAPIISSYCQYFGNFADFETKFESKLHLRDHGISKYMVAQLKSVAFLGLTLYFDVTGVEKKQTC